ncbi:MAG: S-layer homology domain-containing protein [Eubacteriales bacterium]
MKKNNFLFVLSGLFLASLCVPVSQAYTKQEQAFLFTQVNNNLLSIIYSLQTSSEETYSDVSSEDWYYQGVNYVTEEKIMAGTSDNTFSPDNTITRGLLSTVIAGAEKADLGSQENIFLDCSEKWYSDSVNWCVENVIMQGYSPKIFGGEDIVDREQLSVVLYGYASYLGLDVSYRTSFLNSYQDRSKVSTYAIEELSWCFANGIMVDTNNNLRSREYASRGEVAYAIWKLLQL